MADRPVLDFARLLRQLRAEAALTQEELAAAAGVSARSVSDLERGVNRTARKDTAELLAGALGLAEPVRELFVAAARGRAPAADVLAAMEKGEAGAASSPGSAASRGRMWSGCPYLGLVPFQERDAQVFYGRGELVAQLAQRLDGPGILLVAGESGVGKSSLLRAGLMPRLADGALGPWSRQWPRRVITPTSSPLRELAMHLADMSGADPVSVYRSLSAAPGEASMLVEHAVRAAAARAMDPALGDAPAEVSPRLVLVVDQFEELFTAGGDARVGQVEREAFIAALHAAATVPAGPQKLPPALVVVAVRADFLGRLIAYPPLKAALDAGPFTVGPMSEAELRLAMTGPAAEAGLAVELTLTEAVIAELREGAENGVGSGVLPLMSQALAATWEHREGNELTLRAYRRAGGVANAVNRSAQAAYDTLDSRQKDAARLVFTQLTVITPEGQFARRRCTRADLLSPEPQLAADIDVVIDSFSARRLLVLGTDSVEISHDVLLYAWKQFRDWLGDDQIDRVLYSQVVTDARTWDINRRDSSYLYQPGRLATIGAAAIRWQGAPTRYPPLPATGKAFLRAAHRAASRRARQRRGVIAGLVALTLIAVSAAGIAVHDAANASRQRVIALSQQLAVDSLFIASGDPLTARRLAVAAWSVYPSESALSIMTKFLTEQQQDGILPGDPANGGVKALAFSPDGQRLASASGDGTVRLWDPATGQAVGGSIQADTGPGGGVNGVAFSPDGKLLATADANGTVRLWDPATGHPVGVPLLADIGYGVSGVAFSPDGKLLASADADGIVRVWDVAAARAARAPLATLSGSGAGVSAVAFSPDGRRLATADEDGTVRVWDVAAGRTARAPSATWTASKGGVKGVAFSRDGKRLATADADGTVRLWDPATGHPVGVPLLADIGYGVSGVAFSPDGRRLATADADGTVRLWDPASGHPVAIALRMGTGPGGGVNGVAFSADGKLLATAGADGTVRLWDPVTGQAVLGPLLADIADGVNAVAFSPDGKLLASADGDGAVQLWDPATGRTVGDAIQADTGPGGGVNGVAFSPDGKLLATADADGTVRVWDPATGQPVGAPLAAAVGYSVNGVAFSPDGKLLASADGDGTVKTWQISLFTDPYTALCADVGAPTTADWAEYAPGEPQPSVCSG